MMKQPPLKRNDDIELSIEALGSEGQGIGRYDGYTVFVDGALIGEKVLAHIIKPMPNYAIGKLIDVITPASCRIEEKCINASRCGGCMLQHMEYGAQLEFKRQRVIDAFERIGGFRGIEVEDCIGMQEPLHYRNKGSFPCAMHNNTVEAGLYAKNSHRLIPVYDCMLQHEESIHVMSIVREWANCYGISAYDESNQNGILRHIMVRTTTMGETMVVIITTGALPHKDELIDMLLNNIASIESVIHNINPVNSNVILGNKSKTVYGSSTIREYLAGLTFNVSAQSFLQVNPVQTEVLYKKVAEFAELSGNETVFDVYCGIGTISLMLARKAKHVYGIEEVAEAVEDACKNAKNNGIDNVEFVCAKAENVLPEMIKKGLPADCIIMDPPRKGCETSVLNAIVSSGVKKIVYVSCNPATLARDCKLLAEGGYMALKVQPVDMFPWTSHVETVVLLSKLHSDHHIEVELNLDEMDLTASESKATYDEIKA